MRGGGHGVTGVALAEDGLVVDLRRMNSVTVDPQARTAVVGGGATISNLDRGTEPFGLAVTGGRASTTGVGGFTLGGGSGWFERKYGLACDNLVEVELVTADGKVVTASEKEHPDLFWALHGGGGNFGVATSFTFALHPLSDGHGGAHAVAASQGGPSSRRPSATSTSRAQRGRRRAHLPDRAGGAFVPEHLQGQLLFGALVAYAGPQSEATPVIDEMLKLGHEGGMVAQMPYADFQCMLDDPPGQRNYWSAEYLSGLPDEAVARYCEVAAGMIVPSPSMHALFPLGGVLSEPTGWPVPWRDAPWAVHPFGVWTDPADDERGRAWARSVREAVKPWSTGAVYLNFIGDEGARPRRGRVRRTELPASGRDQTQLGPGQPLPPQPQHRSHVCLIGLISFRRQCCARPRVGILEVRQGDLMANGAEESVPSEHDAGGQVLSRGALLCWAGRSSCSACSPFCRKGWPQTSPSWSPSGARRSPTCVRRWASRRSGSVSPTWPRSGATRPG